MRFFFLISLWLSFAATSSAITVEEAYNAVPHTRAEYDRSRSTLGPAESEYLARLFQLSDRALVQRITAMRAMSGGKLDALAAYESEIEKIVRDLEALGEPSAARGLGVILIQAIRGQQEFFRGWSHARESGRPFAVPQGVADSGVDPAIRSSSGKLQQLYGELMRRYANESRENKNSFFQHLCALDFV